MDKTEEIGLVVLPSDDQAAEVMQPGKQAFDFPATAVAAKRTSILGLRPTAIVPVRRDQAGAVRSGQACVQRIAVVGAIANHALRGRGGEALLKRGFDELRLMGRSACNPHGR